VLSENNPKKAAEYIRYQQLSSLAPLSNLDTCRPDGRKKPARDKRASFIRMATSFAPLRFTGRSRVRNSRAARVDSDTVGCDYRFACGYSMCMERSANIAATSATQWPPIRVDERLPTPKELVLAWKPLIDGWDIVLGKQVIESPEQFSHWLPMLPRPE
jgi:hypothetical protein